MALADAHALLFYGLALLERFGVVSLSLVLGPLLCVAAIGVYRLRTSAVFAMLLLNALVLGAAVAGALWVPPPLAVVLVATSLVQMLLPLPMLRAIIRTSRRSRAAAAEPRVRVADPTAAARFATPADDDALEDEEAVDRWSTSGLRRDYPRRERTGMDDIAASFEDAQKRVKASPRRRRTRICSSSTRSTSRRRAATSRIAPRDDGLQGRAKFDAWTAKKGKPRDEAMRSYVALVDRLAR